jgi:hypothetical protein
VLPVRAGYGVRAMLLRRPAVGTGEQPAPHRSPDRQFTGRGPSTWC